MTCVICDKHQNPANVIYEDEDWIITHGPLASQLLGYLYLEPRRHIENWSDFSEKELVKIGPLIKRVEKAMKILLNIDRVYVVTISEAVRHLHFHIIAREETNTIKGLPLIQQATQQDVKTAKHIDEETFLMFIKSIKKFM